MAAAAAVEMFGSTKRRPRATGPQPGAAAAVETFGSTKRGPRAHNPENNFTVDNSGR